MKMLKAKVIGCGLSGITSSILLKERGYDVVIFDKRNHIGGNCFDSNVCGTMLHNYGPHIFHTDDDEVFQFLSRYTEWVPFRLQPKGNSKLGLISLPYSKKTEKEIGRELSQEEILEFIFKDYSEKQWGVSFESIPRTITNRIPKTKDCEDPTWFEGQKYQCLPKHGYTKMMENMLEGFDIRLSCSNEDWRSFDSDLTVYTGKVDEYYDYIYGELPYRSLEFKHTVTDEKMPYFIENQNNDVVKYTRKYDHSYLHHNHAQSTTVITEEYPVKYNQNNIPYYPIPFGEGVEIAKKYIQLSKNEDKTIFLGRLATYQYLDMWMAIKQVMLKFKHSDW
jgi:UDP-galactopyranose mutase